MVQLFIVCVGLYMISNAWLQSLECTIAQHWHPDKDFLYLLYYQSLWLTYFLFAFHSIIIKDSTEIAEEMLQLRVVHNLMIVMGNLEYASSQKQACLTLEVSIYESVCSLLCCWQNDYRKCEILRSKLMLAKDHYDHCEISGGLV